MDRPPPPPTCPIEGRAPPPPARPPPPPPRPPPPPPRPPPPRAPASAIHMSKQPPAKSAAIINLSLVVMIISPSLPTVTCQRPADAARQSLRNRAHDCRRRCGPYRQS